MRANDVLKEGKKMEEVYALARSFIKKMVTYSFYKIKVMQKILKFFKKNFLVANSE
jgi:hypothetical protein